MRRLRIALTIGALLALMAGPVSAAPASTGDAVKGVGIRLSGFGVQYTISVKGGPNGPVGSFLYRGVDFRLTFGGPATCFDVVGNEAVIGGCINHVDGMANAGLLGQAYLVFVADNGSPSGPGQAGPDVVSQAYILPSDEESVDVPADFPSSCPDAATTEHDAYDLQGDIVVRDH